MLPCLVLYSLATGLSANSEYEIAISIGSEHVDVVCHSMVYGRERGFGGRGGHPRKCIHRPRPPRQRQIYRGYPYPRRGWWGRRPIPSRWQRWCIKQYRVRIPRARRWCKHPILTFPYPSLSPPVIKIRIRIRIQSPPPPAPPAAPTAPPPIPPAACKGGPFILAARSWRLTSFCAVALLYAPMSAFCVVALKR